MKNILLIAFLTAMLFVSAAFSQTGLKLGGAAPAFSAMALDGRTYDLNELKGSVVVVTFWSTRCAICHEEIPKLNQFAGRYGDKKVVFLALSMENEEKIAGYLKNNPFKFEILPNSFGTVLQYADRGKDGNLDMGFPSFFVIDQQGLVRYKASGYDKVPTLNATVSKLLTN
ncbi:redoxin domain-containing protein [soil metagenome]